MPRNILVQSNDLHLYPRNAVCPWLVCTIYNKTPVILQPVPLPVLMIYGIPENEGALCQGGSKLHLTQVLPVV